MGLVYFILICFGITQILCYGTIFDSIRPKHQFFHCPMCIGFWVGLFVWALGPYTELFILDRSFMTGFFMACLSSGTSYMLNMLVSDTGLQINVGKKEVADVTGYD